MSLSPDAQRLVTDLQLAPHPEGGHFRRTWTAPTIVDVPQGKRATASAILFVLDRDEEAQWHVVRSDELWLWHGPGILEIHLGGEGDTPSDSPRIVRLGSPLPHEASSPSAGEQTFSEADNPVQFLVPAGTWQRTFARDRAALATCVVSPEFSFKDWKLAENQGK